MLACRAQYHTAHSTQPPRTTPITKHTAHITQPRTTPITKHTAHSTLTHPQRNQIRGQKQRLLPAVPPMDREDHSCLPRAEGSDRGARQRCLVPKKADSGPRSVSGVGAGLALAPFCSFCGCEAEGEVGRPAAAGHGKEADVHRSLRTKNMG